MSSGCRSWMRDTSEATAGFWTGLPPAASVYTALHMALHDSVASAAARALKRGSVHNTWWVTSKATRAAS
eukprot:13447240-Alexandrium_andersonii.AAC.1